MHEGDGRTLLDAEGKGDDAELLAREAKVEDRKDEVEVLGHGLDDDAGDVGLLTYALEDNARDAELGRADDAAELECAPGDAAREEGLKRAAELLKCGDESAPERTRKRKWDKPVELLAREGELLAYEADKEQD
ncbi:hypothetical protein C8R43DRAFT_1140767 [Mycena crocata]|nr:hypothetical protein C8R43DRAFT_1140767 [Mycena crocata]